MEIGIVRLNLVRVQDEPIIPLVYEVVETATQQTTVIDVLVGAFAIVWILGLGAMVLGVSLAGILIIRRNMRNDDPLNPDGDGAIRLGLTSEPGRSQDAEPTGAS